MPEQFANYGYATLASTVDGSTNPVTFSVAAGQGGRFPATGNFRLTVKPASALESDIGEILLVTARTGDVLTAQRAQEGTAIAAHAVGNICRHVLTAGSIRSVLSDYSGFGTSSSRPAAGLAGRQYKPNDSPVAYLDDGTKWLTEFQGSVLSYGPAVAANFTPTNFQAGTMAVQTGDTVYMKGQGTTSDQHQFLLKTPGAANFTATTTVSIAGNLSRMFTFAYLGVRDGTTGTFVAFGIYDNGTSYKLASLKYASNTNNGAAIASNVVGSGTQFVVLRAQFDGTLIVLTYSFDGVTFYTAASFARSAQLANNPNGIMLGVDYTFAADGQAAAAYFLNYIEA